MQVRDQIVKAMQELPEDAGYEDALERLYLLYKVDRGLAQADRANLIPQDEARRRMQTWLK